MFLTIAVVCAMMIVSVKSSMAQIDSSNDQLFASSASIQAEPHTVEQEGNFSAYKQGVMQGVVKNRQAWGQLPEDMSPYNVYLSSGDCAEIGRAKTITWQDGTVEQAIVVDCGGGAESRNWMRQNNIIGGVDYETAERHGFIVGYGYGKATFQLTAEQWELYNQRAKKLEAADAKLEQSFRDADYVEATPVQNAPAPAVETPVVVETPAIVETPIVVETPAKVEKQAEPVSNNYGASRFGYLSQYAPTMMELVISNRQQMGQLPWDLSGYSVFVAMESCDEVGRTKYLTWDDGSVERVLVTDCSGSLETSQWMWDNNIIAEVDYNTAYRHGFVGRIWHGTLTDSY